MADDRATIIRSETTTKTWTVPVAGGFEPVSIKASPEDGLIRLSVGGTNTGPDIQELYAIAEACNEAAVFAAENGLE